MNDFIQVCEPLLAGKEEEYVLDAVKTGWISAQGSYVNMFEDEFAKFCGVKYSTTVSNGTNAIHLGLKALNVSPGDEVIMPDFTMICSALPICYLGAKPIFVDAEPETWNIDPVKIEEKITKKTKAIMVVHIYGHPCDMKTIWEIAKKHELKIIEDAAETHGAEYYGKKCGDLGDIAAFSFFANKVVTTGEGGMVVTNSKDLIDRAKYYKDLCFPLSGERTYFHQDIGFQYRLSNLQAAIGVAQMEKIDDYIEMRINNNALYKKYLNDVGGISFQPEKKGCKNIYWMNAAVVDPIKYGVSRDILMEKLLERGIQTRKFFVPMHKQPALKKYGCDCNGSFPVSSWLSDNGLYLPSGSGLKASEIEYICEVIREIQKKN
ncbi:MAG: DegT/DnrJ/EryC1/StrS family aminotransferase [Armatimonadetes bacterium]|nr:DegT/DnrJ/EryC1/StrS family aminotransferase [Armatimonadota bacterium]